MTRTLILTDNTLALEFARELVSIFGEIDIFQSPHGKFPGIPEIDLRISFHEIIKNYRLVVSLHCKQIFPVDLIKQVRCINVHPGFNPYNRGWFPHAFSIINGLKAGVTIHEMDEKIDHGKIIFQKECEIHTWDTSGTLYRRIMTLEHEMLTEYFAKLRAGDYLPRNVNQNGNINYKKDYEALKQFDLEEAATFRDFINRLRALTHDEYKNAYFIDDTGKKIFMKIFLEPDNSTEKD